jgi:hypothetical protein
MDSRSGCIWWRGFVLWQRGFSTDFSPDMRNRGEEVAVAASIVRDYYPLEFGSRWLSEKCILLVSVLVGTCMEFAHANLKDKDNRLQATGYSNGTMILAPVD